MGRPADLPRSEDEYRELAERAMKLSRDPLEFPAEFKHDPKLGELTPPERGYVVELMRELHPPEGANEQT